VSDLFSKEILMQRRTFVLGASAAVGLTTFGNLPMLHAEDAATANLKCPVSGKAVDAAQSSEFGGGKVYFCCGNCKAKFDKDSSAFTAKANAQLVASGQFAQKGCPFSGGKTKAGTEVEIAGVKVAFCCNNCQGKAAKATPDDQLKLVFADGFAKGFAKK
jgi:YHS domain-containing protein